MAADPYTTLGVKKEATQDEIQKAYRRLAKTLHPDLNPGNKTAEGKFKEVSAAYNLLSDPDKRARFDRGEIDASGSEPPRQQYYRDFADQDGWSAYTSNSGFADFGDYAAAEDILSEIFGREGRAGRAAGGAKMSIIISIFRFLMPSTVASNLLSFQTAPYWTSAGDARWPHSALERQGPRGDGRRSARRCAGRDKRPAASLLHPEGRRYLSGFTISLKEAVLGTKIKVPTPSGTSRWLYQNGQAPAAFSG